MKTQWHAHLKVFREIGNVCLIIGNGRAALGAEGRPLAVCFLLTETSSSLAASARLPWGECFPWRESETSKTQVFNSEWQKQEENAVCLDFQALSPSENHHAFPYLIRSGKQDFVRIPWRGGGLESTGVNG